MAFLLFTLIHDYIIASQINTIKYSQFKQYVKEGKVKDLVLKPQQITGILTVDREGKKDRPFVTVRVDDPELVKLLDEKNISYTGIVESKWLAALLSWVIPLAVFILVWRLLLGRMAGGPQGVLSVGKARAKIYAEREVQTTFKDVAGIDEAKQELEEIVEFLKTPEKFTRLGGKIPKGVLLVGAPGTGKTLLAKAVAGESGVPFFSISGSDFVEMFVGVGAARVRDLFGQAKQQAPCIIFVDELDALGKARGINPMGGHDEREQTLNQMLVEMDGFDANAGVIIMAATNRPEILDPALLRPGRFDRHVAIDRPDLRGREAILKIHTREVKLGPDVDLSKVAALTPGFVGADLANLVNEAALLSARRNKNSVGMAEFQDAIDRIIGGLEKKNRMMNEQEKKIVAYHESGHALVAMSVPTADPVNKVSIIPRGIAALGYTQQLPTEDRYLMTREELLDRLCVLLGGRVAEELVFGDVSTGAQNDLQRATDIARSMVTEYGMSEKLGLVTYAREKRPMFLDTGFVPGKEYSENTAQEIDAEIARLMNEAHERVRAILTEKRELLERLAQKLLEKETIVSDELQELFGAKMAAAEESRP
ncbi:MAG: ATP-dependent zinc metalloprotease FtsH [Deltaproteobacteria bacterium]|nr:ATP-dependent zinc metalloprotease FtsH [Deltaproteobacteria bacterium]MBW2072530.1 ATP-dependent zinc metalloprotease FtsH [Deltaproteobacteria bacterium]